MLISCNPAHITAGRTSFLIIWSDMVKRTRLYEIYRAPPCLVLRNNCSISHAFLHCPMMCCHKGGDQSASQGARNTSITCTWMRPRPAQPLPLADRMDYELGLRVFGNPGDILKEVDLPVATAEASPVDGGRRLGL